MQGFQIEKKVAGGNCKVAGAPSHRENGSLVEKGEAAPPPLQGGMGSFPQKILKIWVPYTLINKG